MHRKHFEYKLDLLEQSLVDVNLQVKLRTLENTPACTAVRLNYAM